MTTYTLHEDSSTKAVSVSHQERRAELTKAGQPRKDGRTYLTTVIDGQFTGPDRWDHARALRADLMGDHAEAQRIRNYLAWDATRQSAGPTSPAELFARLTATS